jgi:twinkle protein
VLRNDYYQPTREDILRFASFVGIRHKIKADEVVFEYCPYCQGKTRDKDTFSINLKTGMFNCFRASCGVHGNMITLSKDFNFQISEDVDRYTNRNYYDNRFKRFKDGHKESTDPAVRYMKSRGISEAVCKEYEITTKSDQDNVLVFPFRDQNGILSFIKYRNMNYKKGDNGSKEWCEADCKPILFGMDKCTEDRRLIITEGQIDSLSVIESGIKNAVSVPTGAQGTTWIPHCYDWIIKNFDEIVVFGDCENNAITLSEMISNRFSKHKKVKIVRMEDYYGFKDANELLINKGKQAVIDAVNNAEMQLSTQVRDMADVEYVDLSQKAKIKTKYSDIDKLLMGGMMFGQVVLLTGKRGNGKSTFASQLVCNALAQNYNCFMYSGELPNYWVKNWIDGQIFGKSKLTNSQIKECEDWYRGRLFIYNSEIVEYEEMEDLLAVLTDTIIKRDIKFAVLDNLMTALEANTNETLYRKQSEFVGKLAKIAKAYEVVIVLVAHPRKTTGNREFDNDEVSGSADITNRVDIVMSYDKDTKRGDNLRVLKITKNRLSGRLKSFDLFFSEDSKRISDNEQLFDWKYLPANNQFIDADDDEIPY